MAIHHIECAALADLPPSRKLVFMAICDSANKDTGLGFPGFDTIQAWSGLGKSQVQANIAILIQDGWVARVTAGRRGARAVFRVFDQIPCCVMHEAFGVGSGQPDATVPVDIQPEKTPETDLGSGLGSGTSPVVVPVQTGPLPSIQASKKEHSPASPSRAMDRFNEFWDAYGHKVSRGPARKAWHTAVKNFDPEQIIQAASAFAAWNITAGTDPKFIPHPATWLSGERWADERTPAVPNGATDDVPRCAVCFRSRTNCERATAKSNDHEYQEAS